MESTATATVYEALVRGITDGRYEPDSWLREAEVAAAIGVSRTPVREVLNRLEAEGFVRIHRNRGAQVIGWTAQDLDDLYDLRVLLEGYAIRRVAAQPDAVDFEGLRALCSKTERMLADDNGSGREEMGRLSIEFHRKLYEGSGNRQLAAMLPPLLSTRFAREAFEHHTVADLERAFAQHREMIEAITAGDPVWAEGIMTAHLRAGRTSLVPMERLPETR